MKIQKVAKLVFSLCIVIIIFSFALEWLNSSLLSSSTGNNGVICFNGRLWDLSAGSIKNSPNCQNAFIDSIFSAILIPFCLSIMVFLTAKIIEKNKYKLRNFLNTKSKVANSKINQIRSESAIEIRKANERFSKLQSDSAKEINKANLLLKSNIKTIKDHPKTQELASRAQELKAETSKSIKNWWKRIALSTACLMEKKEGEHNDPTKFAEFSNSEDYLVLTILVVVCPFVGILGLGGFRLLLLPALAGFIFFTYCFIIMGLNDKNKSGMPSHFRDHYFYEFWGRAFDWKGKTPRRKFWYCYLYISIISMPFYFFMFERLSFYRLGEYLAILLVHSIIFIIPTIGIYIRRLKDIGKSPEWVLLYFLQLPGSLLLLFWYAKPSLEAKSTSKLTFSE